jgi:tetratricopeptide (TPR) repeat protein
LTDINRKLSPREEDRLEQEAIKLMFSSRGDLAGPLFSRLIENAKTGESKARYYMGLGGCGESLHDFEAAVEAYTAGIALDPCDQYTKYFLHNNIAYSLSQLGRHAEAEEHCRIAIATDNQRHNAYKNLGIALVALGKPQEAVEMFIMAVRKQPMDPRAFIKLSQLVNDNVTLQYSIPDLKARLMICRQLVRDAWERNGKRVTLDEDDA